MRIKDVTLGLMSLALIGAGATLIATFFLGYGTSSNSSDESEGFVAPVLQDSDTQDSEEGPGVGSGPENETLWLTVPKMARVFNVVVPNAEGNDEEKLRDYAAIHLEGTGFPWQAGANVYIAGHRLGFPDTSSFLAFYDLDKLENGDLITVTDADGKVYTYEVFRKAVVSPTDFSVTEPVEGKEVLTLQTCTLPDYSQRLVVQAEKVA
jgi:sortase A